VQGHDGGLLIDDPHDAALKDSPVNGTSSSVARAAERLVSG
jgi:hypothetical protein